MKRLRQHSGKPLSNPQTETEDDMKTLVFNLLRAIVVVNAIFTIVLLILGWQTMNRFQAIETTQLAVLATLNAPTPTAVIITVTPAVTNTPSPTITLTPSVTLTPTITLTPSVTLTPTLLVLENACSATITGSGFFYRRPGEIAINNIVTGQQFVILGKTPDNEWYRGYIRYAEGEELVVGFIARRFVNVPINCNVPDFTP